MQYLRALPVLIAVIAYPAIGAGAQEAANTAEVPVFQVEGVAPNDLLNIRATASAGGLIIARFENGAELRNLGCSDVEGTNWCKVQSVDDPRIMGWAAARYLLDPMTGAVDQQVPDESVEQGDPAAPAQ